MEEDGDDIPDIFRKDCDSPTGKKGLGDKRCMLVGVVVLVFIMCGAVIAIFMHRFTGEGEGGREEGVGREGRGGKGRGWETGGACLWELWSWCSSCVEPSSLSSCTDSRVSGEEGREGEGRALGDKRCMLVGVVVLVFIMCGAVIAIFMHRFTGEGEGWGGGGGEVLGGKEGVGKEGRALGDKRCMLVGVVVLVFIMCGAVIAIFMHRFTGKGEGGKEGVGWEGRVGWGGRGWVGGVGREGRGWRGEGLGKEGVGKGRKGWEEGVGRQGWGGRGLGGRGGREG